MNDDLRQRVITIFEQVDGGSTDDMLSMLDRAIEDGDITPEEYDNNEMEIADIFDTGWFTCNQCGWTQPIAQMASDVPDGEDDWICDDCAKELGYDD